MSMRYLVFGFIVLSSWCFGNSARQAAAAGNYAETLQKVESINDSTEALYLKAYSLAHLPGVTHEQLKAAVDAIEKLEPEGSYSQEALYLLGIWEYRKGDFARSLQTLSALTQRYPKGPHHAEAIFYMARSLDQGDNDSATARQLLKEAYEADPTAAFAGEAYFFTYPYADYLAGDPKAIAHLQDMELQFPQSPYLILAHYLNGMILKKSALTKSHRTQQAWNAAIAAFQRAQTVFEDLAAQGKIPPEQSDTFTAVRIRAEIERSQANLAVAMQSSSAKRQICLEYTITSYRNLRQLLREGQDPTIVRFRRGDAFAPLLEECDFGIAQAYIKANDDVAAEEILGELLKSFQDNHITRGYYLARTHTELANIAQRRGDHSAALQGFLQAEEASKGRVLSTDERLDLWISQSRCQQALGHMEAAMILLSQVINDDSISGLRLKAMLLRAELYEEQHRPELAQKQLIALVRKGGEWAHHAKIKLEKDYGIPSPLAHTSSDLSVQR